MILFYTDSFHGLAARFQLNTIELECFFFLEISFKRFDWHVEKVGVVLNLSTLEIKSKGSFFSNRKLHMRYHGDKLLWGIRNEAEAEL